VIYIVRQPVINFLLHRSQPRIYLFRPIVDVFQVLEHYLNVGPLALCHYRKPAFRITS
jgi:hypothetical protein